MRDHGYDCGDLVVVSIDGVQYVIIDLGMRMLIPRELARAQGFPDSYVLDPMFEYVNAKGKKIQKPLTKTAQIRMIGNSVCPPLAKAIIEANYKHEHLLSKVA